MENSSVARFRKWVFKILSLNLNPGWPGCQSLANSEFLVSEHVFKVGSMNLDSGLHSCMEI